MVLIFDLDDTLINTSDLFWKVREEYLALLNIPDMAIETVRDIFEKQDTLNIKEFGYQPERYGKTMLDVYQNFVASNKLEPSETLEKNIFDIGQKIVNNTPDLISGSIDTLKKLKKQKHELLLVTRGAEETQHQKIEFHGLKKYFKEIFVVSHKSAQVFNKIINETGFNIEDVWIIGDSIKSDINPAIVLGVNCIHYKYKHDHYNWIQEHDENPISTNYFEITDLSMVADVILEYNVKENYAVHKDEYHYPHATKYKL